MAMNGDVLGLAIKAAVDAAAAANPADRVAMYKAMGNAIVQHITWNAVVTVTGVSGVTVGSAMSGPGSGTIS